MPLLVCLTIGSRGARAQDGGGAAQPATVEDLIREGVELRKQGRNHLALPVFQQAFDLARTPRTAAQLGLAEASLGYWLSAEQHLTEALAAPRHPWVSQYRRTLEDTLTDVRSHIGDLVVKGSPAGAEVSVNGKPHGPLPLAKPIRLAEGVAELEVRSPGFVPSKRALRIEAGKATEVDVALEPAPATVPEPAQASRSASMPVALGVRDDGGARRPWLRPLGWGAAAAASIGVAVGTYGVLEQRARRQDFDDYVAPGTTIPTCGEKAADRGGPVCQDLHAKASSAARLAVIGFVAGGVLAAAAVTAFVLDDRSERDSVAIAPVLAPGRWALLLSATY